MAHQSVNVTNDVKDIPQYLHRMNLSMIDKLFFADKIQFDMLVDYGCADGALLKELVHWVPESILIGYDKSEEMIRKAKENCDTSKMLFTHSFDPICKRARDMRKDGLKTAILLSSTIHEIISYSSTDEIRAFWKMLFEPVDGEYNFDYILIRDMMPASSVNRVSDMDDVSKVYHAFNGKRELIDFENIWGSIRNNRNLLHFLLKYQFVKPNWEREVRENYIPLYAEDILRMVPRSYDVLYHEHFTLPYIKRCVKQDFGIVLKEPTHLKLILELNGGSSTK